MLRRGGARAAPAQRRSPPSPCASRLRLRSTASRWTSRRIPRNHHADEAGAEPMTVQRSNAPTQSYADTAEITLLGRRLSVLDLTREISPDIPVYPGHMKVAMWDHLTHEESRLRMGDTPFRGYAVKGLSLCDHGSPHMDAGFPLKPGPPEPTI